MQPTIRLCKQSRNDARKRYPVLKPKTRSIVSQPGMDDKVAHRITEYLNQRDETGDLLFLTHAGFFAPTIGIALATGICSSMRHRTSDIIVSFA